MHKRYELHVNGIVVNGTLEHLKFTTENIYSEWVIYCVIESSMNIVRVSHCTWLTVNEYKNIISLKQKGVDFVSICKKYRIGKITARRIVKNEFGVILSAELSI